MAIPGAAAAIREREIKDMAASLKLTFDPEPFEVALGELFALAKAGKVPLEILDRFVGVFEAGGKVFVLETDRAAAAGTDQLAVCAKPSDLFLSFMVACRAGNADLGAVEDALRHIERSALQETQDGEDSAGRPAGEAQ